MKKTNLIVSLMAIASANAFGFTVDSKTLQPVAKGYAVAAAETQNSFGGTGLNKVIKYVEENGADAFGGWIDSETGLFYWDAVFIVGDLATAKELGRKNGQIAIFDLAKKEEIRL